MGPPVIAAAVAAFNSSDLVNRSLLLVGAVWLAVASVIKVLHAREQDKETRRNSEHDGLMGALLVLHALVAKQGSIPSGDADRKLRVAVHRVVPSIDSGKDPQEIEQIVPYVGGTRTEAVGGFRSAPVSLARQSEARNLAQVHGSMMTKWPTRTN